jgi:hypothetical protein
LHGAMVGFPIGVNGGAKPLIDGDERIPSPIQS